MATSSALYTKLLVVIPNLKAVQQHTKLTADGYMDLHLDILSRANDTARIAIAHNYTQNGDVIADPDMEIFVDFKRQTAEAKTYQNLHIYSEVQDDDDDLQTELNQFLDMWLDNLIEQGHKEG
jgi:uncharacterized protein YqiB (DUF1249 family)